MKKFVKNLPGLCWIAVGNLIYAVIVVLFVLPGQLISCGTTGLALVARQLWGIPVSGFVFVFNVAMLLLGLAILLLQSGCRPELAVALLYIAM